MSLTTFGPVEDKVRTQIESCQAAEPGAPAVLCADNHLGYSMPIGGVVGYEGFVSPSAVGYDIACGNCAVRTDRRAPESRSDVRRMMDDIWSTLSFGVGRNNAEKVEHAVLDEIAECHHPVQRGLAQTAANQLGTIGSGNHYVDLFEDEDGWLWVGVHFGSRGFGHKTATWALEQAGSRNDDMMAPPVVIPVASELGALYIDGMERAGRYAYAGREWVVGKVLDLLGAQATLTVHNHHNFAWRETHGGRDLWVHRKGATPAFPGQRGFVGGSMGDAAVILSGVDSALSREALFSTVHGAGRVMSRRQAAGKTKTFTVWQCGQRACGLVFPKGDFQRGEHNARPVCPSCNGKLNRITRTDTVRAGAVDYDAVRQRLSDRGIEIRGGGADEAPECYKRLPDVLDYHAGTVTIEHELRVIGVAMAGNDVVDPFKD
jgi:tRNA-splicing ligase RtcB